MGLPIVQISLALVVTSCRLADPVVVRRVRFGFRNQPKVELGPDGLVQVVGWRVGVARDPAAGKGVTEARRRAERHL